MNQIYAGHTPNLINNLNKTNIFNVSVLNIVHMKIAEEIVWIRKYFKQGSTEYILLCIM